jgi:hypothetical protein
VTPTGKCCAKCSETKPAVEFARDKNRKDGLQAYCKACQRAYRVANKERLGGYFREYCAANRPRISEQRREYRTTHRERIGERNREYAQANRERLLAYLREYNAGPRRLRHGLTRAEREHLAAMQLHRCAVCLDLLGDDRQIDHDHDHCPGRTSCGACVRGVLHKRCNAVVGQFENGTLVDPELAELAACYVEMTALRMAPFFEAIAAAATRRAP